MTLAVILYRFAVNGSFRCQLR